jgi:hypothetical protein
MARRRPTPVGRDDRSAPGAHATSPAPPANATATTAGPHNDDLSVLDEIIDLRCDSLVHGQRHGFCIIRQDGKAGGNDCSTAQNAPQDAAAISVGHWFSPGSNEQTMYEHSCRNNPRTLMPALRLHVEAARCGQSHS